MHCTYCGMPEGTCRAEAMSNSEKNQTCSIELHLSEGIRQAVSELVDITKI